jgi:hypothetical protein
VTLRYRWVTQLAHADAAAALGRREDAARLLTALLPLPAARRRLVRAC